MSANKKLPSPRTLSMSLTDALTKRRSYREYADKALNDEDVATILWASAGLTLPDGHRTVPSAMGYSAVQAYWVDRDASWYYNAAANQLEKLRDGDFRPDTTSDQDFVNKAAATMVLVSNTQRAHGLPETLLDLDAGCMVQAAQLAATSLGLGSVCRASFDREKVLKALGLSSANYLPLVAITVGVKA